MNAQIEYETLYRDAVLRPDMSSSVAAAARRIAANRARYEPIAVATGVPWYVIGILHAVQCEMQFDRNLRDGMPLARSSDRAETFEDAAIQALRSVGLNRIRDWSIARVAWALETWNGFGYRREGIHSPFLWSGTTMYESGLFIAPGVFSRVTVAKACGGMAILKVLLEIEPLAVDLEQPRPAAHPGWVRAEPIVPTITATARSSGTVWAAAGVVVAAVAPLAKPFLPDQRTEATSVLAPLVSLGVKVRANIEILSVCVIAVLAIVIVVRHIRDKRALLALTKGG